MGCILQLTTFASVIGLLSLFIYVCILVVDRGFVENIVDFLT